MTPVQLVQAMMLWLFCARQSPSLSLRSSRIFVNAFQQAPNRWRHHHHQILLRPERKLSTSSSSLDAKKRFGLTLDDFDGNDERQQRVYKALNGYEDDVEKMAMDYIPDYDDGDEDFGGGGGGSKNSKPSTLKPAETETVQQDPSPPGVSSPRSEVEIRSSKYDDFLEHVSRIPKAEESNSHDNFAPPYSNDYYGDDNYGDDDDDDVEPLSPLSHVSSIAEPTHIKPINRQRKDRGDSRRTPPASDSSSATPMPPQPPMPAPNTPLPKSPSPSLDRKSSRSYSSIQEPPMPSPPSPVLEPFTSQPEQEQKSEPSRPSNTSPRPSPSPPSTLSRDEWRAKYAFLDADSDESSNDNNGGTDGESSPQSTTAQRRGNPPPELSSSRRADEMLEAKLQIERLEEEIFTMNGSKFNLKSYKQISQALFGNPDQSTAKQVLEGMAASNILAKLLLQHRQVSQRLSKLEKREATKSTRVTNVLAPRKTQRKTADGRDVIGVSDSSSRLLLLDTSSYIFRAYYSMPPLHRGDGTPCGAVLGFCNMLNRLLLNSMLDGKSPHLVLCKDASGPTFRNDLYHEYKGNRPEAPMDLIPQFELIYQAAEAYGLVQIEAPGYEADDIIATLSRQAMEKGISVDILSGDKDLMQLITNSTEPGGTVEMIDPMTMTRYTHDGVLEKWGVPAHQLGDLLALAGDTADNIPGVPGIGPKIAANLLQEFNTLEELLENSDQIKQVKRKESLQNFADQARMSQELVKLVDDVPADRMVVHPPEASPMNIEDFKMEPMNADRILEFYDAMGFFTIKQQLLNRLKLQQRVAYQTELHPQVQKKKRSSPKPGNKAQPPKPEDFEGVPF
eukprot:scaffold2638_cov114-Cylindrotheca_fusiformis.AAC.13